MSDFIGINAPHLSYVVVWIEGGTTQTTTSPLLAANMSVEPPEILPVVWTEVPEGAPHPNLLRDEPAKLWFDPATGERLSEWKQITGPLFALWDVAQPTPLPTAPKASVPLEVPNHAPQQRPPHRQRPADDGYRERDVQE